MLSITAEYFQRHMIKNDIFGKISLYPPASQGKKKA